MVESWNCVDGPTSSNTELLRKHPSLPRSFSNGYSEPTTVSSVSSRTRVKMNRINMFLSFLKPGGQEEALMPPSWGCLCPKECYLDPSVAMVIRDTPCDFITLEAIMISVWFFISVLVMQGVKPSNRHRRIWNHGITTASIWSICICFWALPLEGDRDPAHSDFKSTVQLSGWDQHPDDHCHECANILFGSDGFHKNYSSPGTMTRHLSKNFSMTVSISSRVNLLAGC
jgi:hypothetical protein